MSAAGPLSVVPSFVNASGRKISQVTESSDLTNRQKIISQILFAITFEKQYKIQNTFIGSN